MSFQRLMEGAKNDNQGDFQVIAGVTMGDEESKYLKIMLTPFMDEL